MSTSGGPKTIYIIRHGEKLGDPSSDSDDGPDLSIRGSARAAALPSLFVPGGTELACALTADSGGFTAKYSANQLKPRFTTPDVLFATKASGSSNRPVETITPLSAALNLPYDASCSDDEYATLATEIKSNSDYTDKIVLICWHHGNIPALAEQFGITQPPTWDATVFDRVWEIAYNPGPPNLQDLPQQLLYGDSKS